MKKIIVVGSLIGDIAFYAPHLPVAGETALGSSYAFGAGGKGSNQATAAHRIGAEVKMISKMGKDALGNIILEHYKKEGMSTEYITFSENGCTGSAAIEIDTGSGQNRIVVVKGANDEIAAKDVMAAAPDFDTCDVVLTQLETSMESVEAAKAMGLKRGKTLILNPAPFQRIPDELFCGVDYITPNETEAEFFSGIPVTDTAGARKAAERFLKMGAKNIVITLGGKGVYFYNGSEEYCIEPPKVKAVDTTGAGDAFNGGFAVALAEDMPTETALKFANCVAAISVTHYGSSPSMPYRPEVDALLMSHYHIEI